MKPKHGLLIVPVLLILVVLGLQSTRTLKAGAEAYLFGYPLVLMDETRRSMTDPKTGRAPINHFAHITIFPDHHYRQVVRPNNDTLYSTAWLDLSIEPLVLTVPEMGDRYYVLPFMDAWTNVFASVGSRTTNSDPGSYVIVGPDWLGTMPQGIPVIRSPTNMSWLIGRIQSDGEKDTSAVHHLQRQCTLTPLSRWGTGVPNQGVMVHADAPDRTEDNPSATVGAMAVGDFFGRLARLMLEQPPAETDAMILKTLAGIGIVPRDDFDFSNLWIGRRFLIERAVIMARDKLQETADSDRSSENNWAVVRDGIGRYGTDYRTRAFVALIGLGALPPEEAVYPNAGKDREGRALSGQHRYRIRFDADRTPPVHAFWSLTIFDEQGFLVDNPIQRYAIGDRNPLLTNPDGTLDIRIQHERPSEGDTNWLPAPEGPFFITMRLYLPKADFLSGHWQLPGIERLD
jgi:hypothetical protein